MEIYTVKVAVKPYTKAYLENNYGNPADIRQDPELNDMVTMMLREGSTRLDKIISSNFPATVELRITKDTFFRYGFTLTKTETLKLKKNQASCTDSHRIPSKPGLFGCEMYQGFSGNFRLPGRRLGI